MKRNTIKWRILKYNIIVIILFTTLVALIFNLAVRFYIEQYVLGQLDRIATRAEDTVLRQGPDFFPPRGRKPPPDKPADNDMVRFYLMLDRSLREPLSVLNADFIFLDTDKNRISPPIPPEFYAAPSQELLNEISAQVSKEGDLKKVLNITIKISGAQYVAIVKPVSGKNTFGLGSIIIFSNIANINQLQLVINFILLVILLLTALIISIFSTIVSQKISDPLSSLNDHIRSIAERKFDSKLQLNVDDELRDLVNNINTMSEKLETHDKAQKTFLQNASHEFRTPLMSIQSYAEGIKYNVVESEIAVNIIIEETKRMTHLVEDLLYLSRLNSIEENYYFSNLNYNELIDSCISRMMAIAIKSNIKISCAKISDNVEILADEEKFSRAITNIIANCIRYAKNEITITSVLQSNKLIELHISDDGLGFEEEELPNIFERFYKGKNGHYGLGLAISKNVVDKHEGKISAQNIANGAMFKIELRISNN